MQVMHPVKRRTTMRTPAKLLTLVLTGGLALAQNPDPQAAQPANQQAMHGAQAANQQAWVAAESANHRALQSAQTAALQRGQVGSAPRPKFSVKPGVYNAA